MKDLKKYLSILWISYKNLTVHKYDILGLNIVFVIRIVVIVSLYKAIYSVGWFWNKNSEYSLQELSWALIFVQALVISKPRITEEINNEVKWWKIVTYLLNPGSYIMYKFLEHFSKFFYNLVIAIFVWIIIWYLLLGSINISFYWFIWWISLLILAMLINFFWYMMIGLISLFIEDSNWFRTMYSAIDRLFAGNILPIPFFPLIFQRVIFLSPFAYTWYTAWLMFVRFDSVKFLNYFLMTIIWSVIYISICNFMYYKAKQKLVINWG